MITEKIIDQFLDECGVTPGEWQFKLECNYGESNLMNGYGCEIASMVRVLSTSRERDHSEQSCISDGKIMATSRQSLKDWILVAWELDHACIAYCKMHFVRAKNNIESALSMPWADVRKRLEEMEGE